MVIALVLLLASAGAALGSGTPVPAERLEWHACPAESLPERVCATLHVPLDYDDPSKGTIEIAVARVQATSPDNRIGSLVLNPGGPGGAGVAALPLMYAALPDELRQRFDVVGFDPRGVGESSPIECFDSVADQTAFYTSFPTVPVGDAEIQARLDASRTLAADCAERNADVLPHLSTANVARDMDLLRQAFGDDLLTYLGSSYGTYLGATYANLFPHNFRAMVLDGVIDPPSYANAGQSVDGFSGDDTNSFLRISSPSGSNLALTEFFETCVAAGPAACAFAEASVAATQAKFDALLAGLVDNPIVINGPAGMLTVGYSVAIETVRGSLYNASLWSGLADGLEALNNEDAAGFLIATQSLGGPIPDEYHNTREATMGSNCVDADNPASPDRFSSMIARAESTNPHFGAAWAYITEPCVFWSAQDDDRYTGPWDTPTDQTILLISRVFDPATPHASAIAASEHLGNAQLLTIDGWGHSYFEGGLSTCANDYMADYLIEGRLPAPGTVCAEDVGPFASGS